MNIIRKIIQIIIVLSFLCVLFSGCVTETNDSDPFFLSSFDSVKIQFQLNTLLQRSGDNNSVETIEESSWSHEFYSYSTVEINGSIDHEWKGNMYTATWNYNYWYDSTNKRGNMTIMFNDDATNIVSLHAKETLTDKNDKTWTYELSAEDISLYESVSTDTFKMYSIRENETCSKIKSLDYDEFVPDTHPKFIPGATSLISYNCDEYSLFIITIFPSEKG